MMWLFVCPSMLRCKGPQEFDVAVCVSLYVERLELQLRQIKMEIMMAVAYLSFTKLPLRLRPACKTKGKKHNKGDGKDKQGNEKGDTQVDEEGDKQGDRREIKINRETGREINRESGGYELGYGEGDT
ncbi:hypothetical protein MAR_028252 [Mya arenaria]|uniref:Uncharacterized protein n=1 Tax=Mya arenaria TaxID=6604 RepID=A0ABY7DD34_MYAAR|nr:hypothetical protein MAR_028252 [Mya arenaria]